MNKKKIVRKKLYMAMALGLIGVTGAAIIATSKAGNNIDTLDNGVYAGNGIDTDTSLSVNSEYENGFQENISLESESDSSDRIYGIGSVSKMYAVTAVMQLVDAGKVELDGPLTDYLSDFKMADERYKDITVRMLMDHTSGIMGTSWRDGFVYKDNSTYHHDNLLNTLSTQRLKADPGEYACYCNDGFDLLELIVENVSGMSYTDYIEENIVAKSGGKQTGTAENMFEDDRIITPVTADNKKYDKFYAMSYGAGGVFATSEDVANFGAAFFDGNTSLLSEDTKEEMSKRWSDDEFKDDNGLGWDFVSLPEYEKAGVKVIGKGGDVVYNHAMLLVAPEEEISVAVTSNDGSSSLDAMFASALLSEALKEEGIEIEEVSMRDFDTVTEIPEEYLKYEGWYASFSVSNDGICRISFPENKYMHVEEMGVNKTKKTDYVLSTEGNFVELSVEVEKEEKETELKTASNPGVLAFEEADNGQVYITSEKAIISPELGSRYYKNYFAERLMENPVGEDVLAKWEEFAEKNIYLTGDSYSSAKYGQGVASLYMIDDLPGYIYVINSSGGALLRISDYENAVAFGTLPDSGNRDIFDIHVEETEEGYQVSTSDGMEYIVEEDIMELDGSFDSIELKNNEAKWFKISDNLANSTITVDRPENSAVYVYNKYGEALFTTHDICASEDIPLPKDGMILFIGEGTIDIEY